MPYQDILDALQENFNITYNVNHLSTILTKEVPKKIAEVARRNRLLIEMPKENWQQCRACGRKFPMDTIFFGHNYAHPDTWQNKCKECERENRIAKGVQTENDGRSKDP
jgi:hypothetical protein